MDESELLIVLSSLPLGGMDVLRGLLDVVLNKPLRCTQDEFAVLFWNKFEYLCELQNLRIKPANGVGIGDIGEEFDTCVRAA